MPFDILVKKDATVDDTLRLIVNAVNVYQNSQFVRQLVQRLDPSDKDGFIKRLFQYVCQNGRYELDIPGIEEVWTPEKTIREGKFDCKKVTVLISSVLKAAGIEPVLKHVYYRGPDGNLTDYTHIYVIVPNPDLNNYITVDPTNDCRYNEEVQHSKATLYHLNGEKMELHMMGRVDPNKQAPITLPSMPATSFQSVINRSACRVDDEMRSICNVPLSSMCGPADYNVDMIGLKAKDGDTVLFEYTAAEGIAHTAKVPLLFAPRAAFLGLLYLGKLLAKTPIKIHLATRLAQAWNKDKSKVRKFWWRMGGEKTASALKTAIVKGSGITISAPYGYGYDYPGLYVQGLVRGPRGFVTMGEPVTLATATAALALAAPVIIAAKALMKELGVFKEGDADAIPPEGTPEPTPPPGLTPPTALSFDVIHDLTMGNPLNAIIKSVIVTSAMSISENIYITVSFVAIIVFASLNKLMK